MRNYSSATARPSCPSPSTRQASRALSANNWTVTKSFPAGKFDTQLSLFHDRNHWPHACVPHDGRFAWDEEKTSWRDIRTLYYFINCMRRRLRLSLWVCELWAATASL